MSTIQQPPQFPCQFQPFQPAFQMNTPPFQPYYPGNYQQFGQGGRGGRGGRGRGRGGGRGGGRGYNQQRQDTSKYCHSHGACGHWSWQCNTPKPGHQNAATFENKMGGSTYYCQK